ncbi:MAG: hypothetical protein AVDCRST_MAG80-1639, partial [uncultured Rubrobacteraceae bacterium]
DGEPHKERRRRLDHGALERGRQEHRDRAGGVGDRGLAEEVGGLRRPRPPAYRRQPRRARVAAHGRQARRGRRRPVTHGACLPHRGGSGEPDRLPDSGQATAAEPAAHRPGALRHGRSAAFYHARGGSGGQRV